MDEYPISALRSNMAALGLTDGEIDNWILPNSILEDILDVIKGIDKWEYFRNFPPGKYFYMSNDPELQQIIELYKKKKSFDLHSGASMAIMFRIVESIAKNGFDKFANNVIVTVQKDMSHILKMRELRKMSEEASRKRLADYNAQHQEE
jgi:hypothetical protein